MPRGKPSQDDRGNRRTITDPVFAHASIALRNAVVQSLSHHLSRIEDGLSVGASGTEFWESASKALGAAIGRALLACAVTYDASPTVYALGELVNLNTGFPRALALVQAQSAQPPARSKGKVAAK